MTDDERAVYDWLESVDHDWTAKGILTALRQMDRPTLLRALGMRQPDADGGPGEGWWIEP